PFPTQQIGERRKSRSVRIIQQTPCFLERVREYLPLNPPPHRMKSSCSRAPAWEHTALKALPHDRIFRQHATASRRNRGGASRTAHWPGGSLGTSEETGWEARPTGNRVQ